ncbi:MAG: hypothetical protein KF745_07975 [Phycisphaeraceae bacterium]|nr:hypothetical protein [Phycisphaeraceae bacterium]
MATKQTIASEAAALTEDANRLLRFMRICDNRCRRNREGEIVVGGATFDESCLEKLGRIGAIEDAPGTAAEIRLRREGKAFADSLLIHRPC